MTNTSDELNVIDNMGSKPRKTSATVVAETDDTSSGMIDEAVMSSIRISSTKTTPVIGALNMAATAHPHRNTAKESAPCN